MSFGFSVGDFLAVLKLVGTVIDGLRESSHASATFRSLIDELFALETALLRVKRIDLDAHQTFQRIALQQAASQCQKTIDAFYKKLQRDQPYLQHSTSNSPLRSTWTKVKWAVCKKDDLETFRAEIRGHTSSIEILLLATQMEATTVQGRTQESQHNQVVNMIQELSCRAMGALSSLSTGIAQSVQQGKALLESSVQIVQTNFRIFQMVHDIHRIILKVSPQVQHQQPVLLIDALNKESPFHLEFVRSSEALLAVLKANLSETKCGPGMIDRGEFVIEESGSQTIDLSQPWDTCFYPGQKVTMSMIFEEEGRRVKTSCPKCYTEHSNNAESDTACIQCGTVFRRVEEIYECAQPSKTAESEHSTKYQELEEPHKHPTHGPYRPWKRKREDNDTSLNMRKFRRIRIVDLHLPTNMTIDEKYRCEYYRHCRDRESLHEWQGQGSGFCTVLTSKGNALIHVVAPGYSAPLLHERISLAPEDCYMRYTDNVIQWRTQEGVNNALSFYDESGCESIWHRIISWRGQKNARPSRPLFGLREPLRDSTAGYRTDASDPNPENLKEPRVSDFSARSLVSVLEASTTKMSIEEWLASSSDDGHHARLASLSDHTNVSARPPSLYNCSEATPTETSISTGLVSRLPGVPLLEELDGALVVPQNQNPIQDESLRHDEPKPDDLASIDSEDESRVVTDVPIAT